MKKIKTVLMTLFVCALGYGSYTAYDYITMTDAERFLLQNIEALTSGEGGGVSHPGCRGIIPPEYCTDDNGKQWKHAERIY